MFSMLSGLAASAMIAGTDPAPPDTTRQAMLQAVGFALTGRDGVDVTATDFDQCIFEIRGGLPFPARFFFSHVRYDQLNLRVSGKNPKGVQVVNLTLRGRGGVWQRILTPEEMPVPGAELTASNKAIGDGPVAPGDKPQDSLTLQILTTDGPRVRASWDYIYSHGCHPQPPES